MRLHHVELVEVEHLEQVVKVVHRLVRDGVLREAQIPDIRLELLIAVLARLVQLVDEVLEQLSVENLVVAHEAEHVQLLVCLVEVEEVLVVRDQRVGDFDPNVKFDALLLYCASWVFK